MSIDFGSHVSISRLDGAELEAEEENRIRAAARSLQFTRSARIGSFDHFDLRFDGGYGRGGWEVTVFLSGYYIGDDVGNDGLDPEVVMARECPVVEEFAEALAKLLGEEYEVVPSTDWNGGG